ncbi:MAG: ABC transporter permease [Terriglobales bacterium]
MHNLLTDVRYALRNLAHARGFAAVAILTLALGIGATTAMFSVVNAVLLRPLPYRNPEQLVAINEFDSEHGVPEIPEHNLSYPDYRAVAARSHSLQAVAPYFFSDYTVTGAGAPLHVEGEIVGANLFSLLGVQPALGRAFLPGEDAPGHFVAIISDRFWREHFDADRSVIGRSIDLQGQSYTIVGVMPRGFQFVARSKPDDLWVTFSGKSEVDNPGDTPWTEQRGNRSTFVIARLKPGVTVAQANADLASIYHALASEYPDANLHIGMVARPELQHLVGSTRTPLLILLGAVGLVLLIACANVANLLLARAAGRGREIATRAALGATRMRIVRQLVTESVVLSIAGGALGAGIATWAVSALLKLYPDNLPRAVEIGIDFRVLLFTAALTIVTGIVFGLLPAWRVSSPNLAATMREGGRTSTAGPAHNRLRSAIVVAQTALGVMLLVGAGLLLRSFARLSRADMGIDPHHVLTADFDLSKTRYKPDQMDRFVSDFLARVRTMPGVISAGGAMPLPMGGNDGWGIYFNILRHPVPPAQQPGADFHAVTAQFFETVKIPLLGGRTFDERDQRNSKPVMIISAALAKKYFPHEDPIGQMIKIGAGEGKARENYETREVIGVVGDIRSSVLTDPPGPAYYVPFPQLIWSVPTVVVRTSGDPNAIAPDINKILQSMDPEAPLYDVSTMGDWLALDLGRARFQAILLAIFAVVALLLTAIGLYGVIAYSVTQRTHEIGVRMALGASRTRVLAMVLSRGVQLTILGIALGVAGALALARVIATLLYEIPPRDPATYIMVCVVLGAVALLASYIPALRAARTDPMEALRYE